jgi:hypothetical protein
VAENSSNYAVCNTSKFIGKREVPKTRKPKKFEGFIATKECFSHYLKTGKIKKTI